MVETPAHYRHDCPHCDTKSIAFDVIHEDVLSRPSSRGGSVTVGHVYLRCPDCKYGAFTVIGGGLRMVERGKSWEICFHPEPYKPNVPAYLPDNVSSRFLQGCNILIESPEAAVGMFRRSLEIGLDGILTDPPRELFKKIEAAAKEGLLTSDLADWAHHIRDQGNKAVHANTEYPPEDAKEMRNFTEMVLTYIFTMPKTVEAMRAKSEAGE